VVQEYLSHPYLIDGLKFDMRIYVLIFSCEPLKIFLHKEGLVRFATQPYVPIDLNSNRDQMQNMFVHLTNYALNKDNGDFKMPQNVNDNTSHKRSISSLFKTLKSQGKDVDKMWAEIKDLIIKTMLTVQPELAHSYRTCQPAD
jgi:tubulin polyglutamylase TTLL6/13